MDQLVIPVPKRVTSPLFPTLSKILRFSLCLQCPTENCPFSWKSKFSLFFLCIAGWERSIGHDNVVLTWINNFWAENWNCKEFRKQIFMDKKVIAWWKVALLKSQVCDLFIHSYISTFYVKHSLHLNFLEIIRTYRNFWNLSKLILTCVNLFILKLIFVKVKRMYPKLDI